ncbi:MAG: flagellar motor switch protein FliM [Pseudomonadales bacterium]|nr:flagellar motor switch protein FliM [Pseudomonadales bacterium]
MADDVLSQEEIDALMGGGSSDEVTSTEPEYAEGEARPYDLTSEDRIIQSRLPALEVINEKFARFYRGSVYRLLRHPADISVGGVQLMKYSEYVQSLYVPTSLNVIRVKPFRGAALMVYDASLVLKMVDHFFGGDGQNVKVEGRDFTPTELRLVRRLLEVAFSDMAKAWESTIPIDMAYMSREINPSLVNIVSASEIMVVNSFRIELPSGGGEFHFVLPLSMLEPYKKRLDNISQSSDLEHDTQWQPNLERQILDIEVPVSCPVVEAELTLGDVVNFKAGDVISVDMEDEHVVFANLAPVFIAKLGKSRGCLALEIEETFVKH